MSNLNRIYNLFILAQNYSHEFKGQNHRTVWYWIIYDTVKTLTKYTATMRVQGSCSYLLHASSLEKIQQQIMKSTKPRTST